MNAYSIHLRCNLQRKQRNLQFLPQKLSQKCVSALSTPINAEIHTLHRYCFLGKFVWVPKFVAHTLQSFAVANKTCGSFQIVGFKGEARWGWHYMVLVQPFPCEKSVTLEHEQSRQQQDIRKTYFQTFCVFFSTKIFLKQYLIKFTVLVEVKVI